MVIAALAHSNVRPYVPLAELSTAVAAKENEINARFPDRRVVKRVKD
jgi:hypothetical protein